MLPLTFGTFLKQAGALKVMLVANGKTERDSELPTSGFNLAFCIRYLCQSV
jgi:hypothetical protein